MKAGISKSSLMDIMREPFFTTFLSFGFTSKEITVKSAYKNTVLPVSTIVGLSYGMMLGGTFLIESIFDWPGLGQFGVLSILTGDFPAIIGLTLIYSISYVVINFLTSEKYIDVRGTMVVGSGVTFNMGQDTYIKTENSGKLEVNGTVSDSVTFTGNNWRGLSLIKESSIKYSRILNTSNQNYWDWFVKLERSTIENSRISGSRYGPRISNNSTIKNTSY